MTKVLITGMSGLIGGLLKEHLNSLEGYKLSALNRSEVEGVQNFRADISDLEAIKPAFVGQDVAVHLAAYLGSDDWDGQLNGNIVGTYNVFEAAKRTGVKRVVFASSQHATGGYYLDEPWKHIVEGNFDRLKHGEYQLLDETCQVRPDGYYGTSKAYGEALGNYYKDYHGLSSIHLRIGWVVSADDPTFSPFALSLWLSHRDMAQLTQLSLDAPESHRYGIYYATSDNMWKIWDISRAKSELGYRPDDAAGEEFTVGPVPLRDQ